jgi:hypothetical protein
MSLSYIMQAPNTKCNVSISIYSSLLLLNIANISRLTYTYFSNLKVLSYSIFYLNSVSFCISLVSSKAFLE